MPHLLGSTANEVTAIWQQEVREKFPLLVRQGITAYGGEAYFWFAIAGLGKTLNDWEGPKTSEEQEIFDTNQQRAIADIRSHGISEELISAGLDLGLRMIGKAQELEQSAKQKNRKETI